MLKSAHIRNFRCLRDVEIDFEPLTVFVGPNASGKSAILHALYPTAGSSALDRWRHEAAVSVAVEHVPWNQPDRICTLTKSGDGEGVGAQYAYQLLRLDTERLGEPRVVQHELALSTGGENLVNVFRSMEREHQAKVAGQLTELVPVLRDVDARPVGGLGGGEQILLFADRWKEDLWYRPAEVSTGTLLLLAFLVLQHQARPVEVLAIEEPERGLHPYLLKEVVGLMRRFSTGEIGDRPVQILLATQSPALLDLVEPHEVRFLSRTEDGGVAVSTPDTTTESWRQAYAENLESLGSLWLGGGLGGVPGG